MACGVVWKTPRFSSLRARVAVRSATASVRCGRCLRSRFCLRLSLSPPAARSESKWLLVRRTQCCPSRRARRPPVRAARGVSPTSSVCSSLTATPPRALSRCSCSFSFNLFTGFRRVDIAVAVAGCHVHCSLQAALVRGSFREPAAESCWKGVFYSRVSFLFVTNAKCYTDGFISGSF